MQKIDHRLLYELSENSRISLVQLGKKLKKSPQRLKYAISRLRTSGIIRDSYAVFDYSYFGLLKFRVYFKGAYIGEKDKARAISKLRGIPYVSAIYELIGEYDLVVEFLSTNPSKFNKEFKNAVKLLPKQSDHKTILNLVTYLCPRNYLKTGTKKVEMIIGGDRDIVDLSENDWIVIKTLLEKPKARLTELAKSTKLNPRTVKNKIIDLEERKILNGFKSIVDTNAIGVTKTRLFLKLHNVTQDRETNLVDFLIKNNNVVQINKTIGDWDVEIDIETIQKGQTRFLILKIKEKFQDIIERFKLIQFDQYHMRSYLPQFIFTKP